MSFIKTVRALLGPQGCCKFSPTCTRYADNQLRTTPLFTALKNIIMRLAQCHPF